MGGVFDSPADAWPDDPLAFVFLAENMRDRRWVMGGFLAEGAGIDSAGAARSDDCDASEAILEVGSANLAFSPRSLMEPVEPVGDGLGRGWLDFGSRLETVAIRVAMVQGEGEVGVVARRGDGVESTRSCQAPRRDGERHTQEAEPSRQVPDSDSDQ